MARQPECKPLPRRELPHPGTLLASLAMILLFLFATGGGFILGVLPFVGGWRGSQYQDHASWGIAHAAVIGLSIGIGTTYAVWREWRRAPTPVDEEDETP